jgi:hypothetical protein
LASAADQAIEVRYISPNLPTQALIHGDISNLTPSFTKKLATSRASDLRVVAQFEFLLFHSNHTPKRTGAIHPRKST